MRARSVVGIVAALALVALAAGVDAAVSWSAQSSLSTSVHAPLAEFAKGTGASRSVFVTGFTLSANKTSFTATLIGRAGGAVLVKDVEDVVSHDTVARSVTLRATQIVNAQVTQFTWTVRNGTTTVATMDVLAASPSVTFTLPANATYAVDLRVTLLPGSGHNNADITLALGMSVQ